MLVGQGGAPTRHLKSGLPAGLARDSNRLVPGPPTCCIEALSTYMDGIRNRDYDLQRSFLSNWTPYDSIKGLSGVEVRFNPYAHAFLGISSGMG